MGDMKTKAEEQRKIRIEKIRDTVEENELRVRLLEAKIQIRKLQTELKSKP